MSIKLMTATFQAPMESAPLKFTLLSLCDNAKDDGLLFPSNKETAEKTSQSVRTVITHLQSLMEMGIVHDTGERIGRTKQIKVLRISLEAIQNLSMQNLHSLEEADSELKDANVAPFKNETDDRKGAGASPLKGENDVGKGESDDRKGETDDRKGENDSRKGEAASHGTVINHQEPSEEADGMALGAPVVVDVSDGTKIRFVPSPDWQPEIPNATKLHWEETDKVPWAWILRQIKNYVRAVQDMDPQTAEVWTIRFVKSVNKKIAAGEHLGTRSPGKQDISARAAAVGLAARPGESWQVFESRVSQAEAAL